MNSCRINYIDRMKGMAILIVVLAHVFLFSFDMSDSIIFRFCASFEMPLFMFISGFVAYIDSHFNNTRCAQKLRKRFVSYICPAFVVSYVVALYDFLILDNREIDIVDTLTGGLWYLKALAIFSFLQAILMKCKNAKTELLLIAVAEVVFLVGWKTCPLLYQLFCLEHCFFFYPFFMLGYYSRKYDLVKVLKSRNWIFTVSLIGYVCLLNASIDGYVLRFLSERIVRPVFAITAITYLFAIRENVENRLEKWLNRIGTKTLDIYIYHGVLIQSFYSCFDFRFVKQTGSVMNNPITYCMIALLTTLLLAYVSMAIGVLVRKSNFLEKIVYGKFDTLKI